LSSVLRLLNRIKSPNSLTPVERALVQGAKATFEELTGVCRELLGATAPSNDAGAFQVSEGSIRPGVAAPPSPEAYASTAPSLAPPTAAPRPVRTMEDSGDKPRSAKRPATGLT